MHRFPSAAPKIAQILVLLVLGALAGCRQIAPAGFSGDVDVLLARGEAFAEFTARQPASSLSDEDVLVLGYLERARLGLGSPFRLIDFALSDPQLSEGRRELLAFALLANTLQDQTYQVESTVLEYVQFPRIYRPRGLGEQQMRLIEQTISAAPTASSGERAVRLGYRLAEAERTVQSIPYSVVAHTAAMVADRRRAREDATLLLRTAVQRSADPLKLLSRWRSELRFQVEGPALRLPSVREEEWEAREGPQVALALRTLAQRLSARTTLVPPEGGAEQWEHSPLLSPGAAARLRALAADRDYPAQAPLAVALSINRDGFLADSSLSAQQRAARQTFLDLSWNEERLVSEAHLLRASGESAGRQLCLVLLQAAVFFRVWNQEEPWFPGDPAPASRDVEARFGLAAIEFDDSVPGSWRPYYLRVLARGLADLQRVLPTASIRGLRIRIGPLPEGLHALALHDPATRTLVLPPQSGTGTLAHEIAHDLDWQLARKRYGRRGAYATDLAVRRGQGDRIATSVNDLAASLVRPRQDTVVRPHDVRPAEVFARGTDWLVAALLARQGRTGGYLTSYQDAAITGYGTTRGPDIGGGAVPSLLGILDAIAPVVDSSRAWAMDQHGPSRTLTPMEIARAIVRTTAHLPPGERMAAISVARERSLSSLRDPSCRLSSAQGLRRLVDAQRSLIDAAARAAFRGAAVDEIHLMAEQNLGPFVRGRVDAWLARRLYGAPEPVDSVVDALSPSFEDVLLRAQTLEREETEQARTPFSPGLTTPLCGSNPFATPRVPTARRVSPIPAQPVRRPAATTLSEQPRFLPTDPWRLAE